VTVLLTNQNLVIVYS